MATTFEGKVIVITGAGSGIGRATALKLAKAGATLALADIDSESLAHTIRLCTQVCQDQETKHFMHRLDVRPTEDVQRFIQQVIERFGFITHVFNCAGINPTKLQIDETTDEYWQRMIDTNLKSIFTMTRACLPHMQDGSSFVNVSSVCGLNPTEGIGVYCATKYAVIGLSKCIALETGRRGIRVNVICPGAIETPTNNSVRAGPAKIESTAESIGLGRLGSVEEVADVVAFLFSDESRYVNGSVVEIHGGMGMP